MIILLCNFTPSLLRGCLFTVPASLSRILEHMTLNSYQMESKTIHHTCHKTRNSSKTLKIFVHKFLCVCVCRLVVCVQTKPGWCTNRSDRPACDEHTRHMTHVIWQARVYSDPWLSAGWTTCNSWVNLSGTQRHAPLLHSGNWSTTSTLSTTH